VTLAIPIYYGAKIWFFNSPDRAEKKNINMVSTANFDCRRRKKIPLRFEEGKSDYKML